MKIDFCQHFGNNGGSNGDISQWDYLMYLTGLLNVPLKMKIEISLEFGEKVQSSKRNDLELFALGICTYVVYCILLYYCTVVLVLYSGLGR